MAAPGGARRPLLLLLLLLGLVLGAGAQFVVRSGNGSACVVASFSAAFRVLYDSASGPRNATLELPASARVADASSCGDSASGPGLTLLFGSGHSLSLDFVGNGSRYGVRRLRFAYNLSDASVFPGASAAGPVAVESDPGIRADLGTKYRCDSRRRLRLGDSTELWLSNTTIQAFLANGSLSRQETRCEQDAPPPTSAPPRPAPSPETPSVGKYNVSDANGTCLLAHVGLQLNVTYLRNDSVTVTRVFSVDPNKTAVGGSCAPQLATLELREADSTTLVLQFALNASASRFFLQGVRLNMTLPDAREPSFREANGSLRALEASVGHSYRCSAEQRLPVTPAFTLTVVRAWLQAFRVQGGQFGSAEECPLDENSMLIPIAVGGALAGLVLVVLIAYLVGRKRSHAGYQTI